MGAEAATGNDDIATAGQVFSEIGRLVPAAARTRRIDYHRICAGKRGGIAHRPHALPEVLAGLLGTNAPHGVLAGGGKGGLDLARASGEILFAGFGAQVIGIGDRSAAHPRGIPDLCLYRSGAFPTGRVAADRIDQVLIAARVIVLLDQFPSDSELSRAQTGKADGGDRCAILCRGSEGK